MKKEFDRSSMLCLQIRVPPLLRCVLPRNSTEFEITRKSRAPFTIVECFDDETGSWQAKLAMQGTRGRDKNGCCTACTHQSLSDKLQGSSEPASGTTLSRCPPLGSPCTRRSRLLKRRIASTAAGNWNRLLILVLNPKLTGISNVSDIN